MTGISHKKIVQKKLYKGTKKRKKIKNKIKNEKIKTVIIDGAYFFLHRNYKNQIN